MQKSQEKRETFMELTPQILIVVLPLIFLGGFVDSVAGGGGLITLPAYLMAPARSTTMQAARKSPSCADAR